MSVSISLNLSVRLQNDKLLLWWLISLWRAPSKSHKNNISNRIESMFVSRDIKIGFFIFVQQILLQQANECLCESLKNWQAERWGRFKFQIRSIFCRLVILILIHWMQSKNSIFRSDSLCMKTCCHFYERHFVWIWIWISECSLISFPFFFVNESFTFALGPLLS